MNVKELIEKLQKYDQEMDVVIHPFLDTHDVDYEAFSADKVIRGDIAPITLAVIEAQSTLSSFDDGGCENIIYEYADFDNPINKKKVLMISSPEFKYGVSLEEEVE